MKKLLVAVLSVILAAATTFTAKSQEKVKTENRNDDAWSNSGGNHVPGTWMAYIEDEKVYIRLTGEDWSAERSFPLAELRTLPTSEGTFALTREAGTITFKGTFDGGKGRGFYALAENASFKSYLEQKGYLGLDKELMLNIFLTDINKSYFDFMKANGYYEISNSQLKDLAQQNLNRKVLGDYFNLFKTEDGGHPSIEKMVDLREHGSHTHIHTHSL